MPQYESVHFKRQFLRIAKFLEKMKRRKIVSFLVLQNFSLCCFPEEMIDTFEKMHLEAESSIWAGVIFVVHHSYVLASSGMVALRERPKLCNKIWVTCIMLIIIPMYAQACPSYPAWVTGTSARCSQVWYLMISTKALASAHLCHSPIYVVGGCMGSKIEPTW